jgi:hypothetical protein
MSNDFYMHSAQRRLQMLNVERQSALADLAAYQSNGDADSAASTIQQIADIDAQQRNLVDLHQRYVESQTPQYAPPASQEERNARPWDRMDWSDVVEMTRNSKYAKNIRPDDPYMVAGYWEGRRRSARGE